MVIIGNENETASGLDAVFVVILILDWHCKEVRIFRLVSFSWIFLDGIYKENSVSGP